MSWKPSSAAAPVAARPAAQDQARRFQHVEVVRQRVRGQAGAFLELERRPIRSEEVLDDRQPDRIPERRVAPSTFHEGRFGHVAKALPQQELSQENLRLKPGRPRSPDARTIGA